MDAETFTCPRCTYTSPLRPGLRYCPRCGLADAPWAGGSGPLELTVDGRRCSVRERMAIGSISSIYRCRIGNGRKLIEAVLKVARDSRSNDLIANEAAVLRLLHAGDGEGRFAPFLPVVEGTLSISDAGSDVPRQANLLRMHADISGPDELYTVEEVSRIYPGGLDQRHVAWVWRRLLTVLGFAHSRGVAHAAVLPPHVLIEGRDHKLVLIDWCAAARYSDGCGMPVAIISGGHMEWYRSQGATTSPPAPSLDLALGARTMIQLLGGDPVDAKLPDSIEPALARYFLRCMDETSPRPRDAWGLLEDFDKVIGALWGPRKFVELELPPRGGA